jgi:hypothetical protein
LPAELQKSKKIMQQLPGVFSFSKFKTCEMKRIRQHSVRSRISSGMANTFGSRGGLRGPTVPPPCPIRELSQREHPSSRSVLLQSDVLERRRPWVRIDPHQGRIGLVIEVARGLGLASEMLGPAPLLELEKLAMSRMIGALLAMR